MRGSTVSGLRIIDWTIWQQVPVATTMLADLGAEVIKIEERDKGDPGDPGRAIYAVAGGMAEKSGRNFYFEARGLCRSWAAIPGIYRIDSLNLEA